MKKIVIIIIAIALFGVGYMVLRRPSEPTLPQTVPAQETGYGQATAPSSSEKIPFDTNDNLDQAMRELDQTE